MSQMQKLSTGSLEGISAMAIFCRVLQGGGVRFKYDYILFAFIISHFFLLSNLWKAMWVLGARDEMTHYQNLVTGRFGPQQFAFCYLFSNNFLCFIAICAFSFLKITVVLIKLCVYFAKLNKWAVSEANNTLIELINDLCFLINELNGVGIEDHII